MSVSRRSFLSSAAWGLAAGRTAPGDRITVGIIGSGGRAIFETRQYPFFDTAEIVAVADAQQSRRENAVQALGDAYRGIRAYADFRELLAQKDIDAVYIASPDHWHVTMLQHALRAGKHVHCEKPLGVSVEQDVAALQAVRRARTVFQYGAERRSTAEARKGIELVLNGRIGKVKEIFVVGPPSARGGNPGPVMVPPKGFDYDMWLGPAPVQPFCSDRCLETGPANGIFGIYDYTLGNIANWAAHPLDLMQWWADHASRMSIPVRYEGCGEIAQGGLFDTVCHWDVQCTYSDGLILRMVDNETYKRYRDAPHPQMPFGRPGVTQVHNGAVFIGSEGWAIVSYEKVVTHPANLMDSEIGASEIKLIDSALSAVPPGMAKGHQQTATAAHHQNWLKAIRGQAKAVGGDIESAVRSDLISNLCELCVRTGAPLGWDPARQRITGNAEAARLAKRPMRAPWGVS